jgi:hypothetical protein
MTEDDPRLIYMPLDQVTAATGSVDTIRNAWWTVHPERGLVFWTQTPLRGLRSASPQCNTDKNVSDMVSPRMFPWAEVRQIPLVLQPKDFSS